VVSREPCDRALAQLTAGWLWRKFQHKSASLSGMAHQAKNYVRSAVAGSMPMATDARQF
jgi:hypothetical protein